MIRKIPHFNAVTRVATALAAFMAVAAPRKWWQPHGSKGEQHEAARQVGRVQRGRRHRGLRGHDRRPLEMV